MAWFRKNWRQRRLEVRRAAPETEPPLTRWIRQPGVFGSLMLAAVFFLTAAFLGIWPPDPLPYRKGQFMPSDVTARVDFRVLSPELFEEARRLADSATPETFRLNAALLDEILSSLEKIPSRLEAAGTPRKADPELRSELGLYPLPPAPANLSDSDGSAKALPPPSREDEEAFAEWVALGKPERRPKFAAMCKGLREDLVRCYIVRPDRVSEQQRRAADHVLLTDGRTVVKQKVVDLVAENEGRKVRELLMSSVERFPAKIRRNVETFLTKRLRDREIYQYDAETSRRDRALAVQAVVQSPPDSCYRHYTEDQVLARNTESLSAEDSEDADLDLARRGLSEEEYKLLQAEHEAWLQHERNVSPLRPWLRLAGRIAVFLLLTALLCLYIYHYQHFLVEENWRGLKLTLLLLAMLGMSKSLLLPSWAHPQAVLLPMCIAAIVLTVAHDQRFALAVGAILSAFVVFQMHEGLAMLIVLIGAQMLCIFQLREVRTRSKLVVTALTAAAGIFVVVLALSIQTGAPWRFALRDGGWAAAMVLLAGLIVQSLLPAVERLFNVATGSTLLEWCDASKPLLKRLAMESPGTYNHSLQLGAMCEAAAEAVGARGLLARVGAYYHDIGKINKPDYFAENQPPGRNKHEKLSPAMSLLIIINHVKDGMELARRYGLPVVLRGFIATHHGTTVVRYFYHSAARRSEGDRGAAPDENQYRYPGPKPRLKEEAILMLADAAESSVRALSEPTPTSIRTQVRRVVNERLDDGQFDECDLTLREVHQIEDSLVKSLCGIYHARIAYPREDRLEKAERNGKKSGENGENREESAPLPPQSSEGEEG